MRALALAMYNVNKKCFLLFFLFLFEMCASLLAHETTTPIKDIDHIRSVATFISILDQIPMQRQRDAFVGYACKRLVHDIGLRADLWLLEFHARIDQLSERIDVVAHVDEVFSAKGESRPLVDQALVVSVLYQIYRDYAARPLGIMPLCKQIWERYRASRKEKITHILKNIFTHPVDSFEKHPVIALATWAGVGAVIGYLGYVVLRAVRIRA